MIKNKVFQYTIITTITLCFISLVIGFWIGWLFSFRIIFGIFFLIFLPGFIWLQIIIRKTNYISTIEKIIYSILISFVLVSLNIYLFNKLLKISISSTSILWQNLLLIIIGLTFLIIIKNKGKLKNE